MVLCGWWVCVCINGGFSPVSRARVAAGGVRSPKIVLFLGQSGARLAYGKNKGFFRENRRFSLMFPLEKNLTKLE